jgi:hypothetical protein
MIPTHPSLGCNPSTKKVGGGIMKSNGLAAEELWYLAEIVD